MSKWSAYNRSALDKRTSKRIRYIVIYLRLSCVSFEKAKINPVIDIINNIEL